MGNTLSSRRSLQGKTLEHELEASSLPTNGSHLPSHSLPVSRLQKDCFEVEFDKLKVELRAKVLDYGDAVQPHTDEGGEAYYIGDAYEGVESEWAAEWKVKKYVILLVLRNLVV